MDELLMVMVEALVLWVGLLVMGSFIRLCLNPHTMRKEAKLRKARMFSGLTGRELFARINNEYGNIFRLDYTADGYGKAVPTVGLSRLSFSLDVLRRSDYGTIYVPRACCNDTSLMAAALVTHELGHLILLTKHAAVFFSVFLQRFITSASAVISTLCAVGYAAFHIAGLGEHAWLFLAVGVLLAVFWVVIVVIEWKATACGLRAAFAVGALTDGETLSCKEIGRLWVMTYIYKLYIFSVPVIVMLVMRSQ